MDEGMHTGTTLAIIQVRRFCIYCYYYFFFNLLPLVGTAHTLISQTNMSSQRWSEYHSSSPTRSHIKVWV